MRVSNGQWTWFLTNGSAFRLVVALAAGWRFLLPSTSAVDGLHLCLLSLALCPMFLSTAATLWPAVAAVAYRALFASGDGWHMLLAVAAAASRVAWLRELRQPRPCRAFSAVAAARLAPLALEPVGLNAAAAAATAAASLLTSSAGALAARLRAGEVSSTRLVELFIAQAVAADAEINALCADRFEAARAEAAAADERYRAAMGDAKALVALPPFLGVPIIGKECMELPGMPFTSGLVSRAGIVGSRAAPPLRRLAEQGGFVFLGVGNLSEACMWFESYNGVHGRSCNPYDVRRTCGGSSGGTAALVAACAAPVGVTSDVGGSTRIPAFYNGLFGHKPTGGLVTNEGCIPRCEGERKRFCQVGPTARHAVDLMPMLRLMAGEGAEMQEHRMRMEFDSLGGHGDGQFGTRAAALLPLGDPTPFLARGGGGGGGGGGGSSSGKAPPSAAAAALRGLRVVNCGLVSGGSALVSARDPELCAAQERVAAWLRDVGGCEVVPFPAALQAPMRAAFDVWSAMLSGGEGHVAFREIIAERKEAAGGVWVVWELLKLLLCGAGGSDHTLPALGLALVERVPELLPGPTEALRARGAALRTQLEELIGDGVLLYPSLPTVAPLHDGAIARVADSGATALWNVMELPVTAVPLGLARRGNCMPLGLQIVAGPGQDHKSIGLAMALEEAGVAGWQPPPPLPHDGQC